MTTVNKKFSPGDKVILAYPECEAHKAIEDFIGFVEEAYETECTIYKDDPNEGFWVKNSEIELIAKASIARPILEERKVGKVQMDLFDSGFPNAINEVAKVMTWAAENKGYKPHDWKWLPNAETEFSAAASRHRVKGFIQKAEGTPAIERTDEESNIVHLAHAAFNVLAELELVLTGKIK